MKAENHLENKSLSPAVRKIVAENKIDLENGEKNL